MGSNGQEEIRSPEEGELLRARVVEGAIARKTVRQIAGELGISWEWARKILTEELRAARGRRVTQQDLLLEVELQAVETSLRHLQEMIAKHPWKTKAHTTWLRVQERFLLLQGIRLTLPNATAVQVNLSAPGGEINLTGSTDAELLELLDEPAPPLLLTGRAEAGVEETG